MGIGALMDRVVHCSYRYTAGSGYLGPALGGIDPGPDGFEVSAQGDYDGNGVRSTFLVAGLKDPKTGWFTVSGVSSFSPNE